MNTEQVAEIVRSAATEALKDYLRMCGLDSPWEVPEAFLATESAKALANAGLRVALEYRLDRIGDHPSVAGIDPAPVRLQKAHAKLDVAILKSEGDDPWKFSIDGIIEFKKHYWLNDDADLIKHMIKEKGVTHGVLALLVVGDKPQRVIDEEKRLTDALRSSVSPDTSGFSWQKLPNSPPPEKYLPILNPNIRDRYWTIACLIPVRA